MACEWIEVLAFITHWVAHSEVVVLPRWALSVSLAGTTKNIQSVSAQTLRTDFCHAVENFARKSRLGGRESTALAETIVVSIGRIVWTSIGISLPGCSEERGFSYVCNSQKVIPLFKIDRRRIDLVLIAHVV